MKRSRLIYMLSLFILAYTSCDNEPIDSTLATQGTGGSGNGNGGSTVACIEATENTTTAAANYAAVSPGDSNFTSVCNAYATALENQISHCGDTGGVLQAIADALDCNPDPVASLVGTWRIISLESNGVEELQDELTAAGICFWHEVYTDTTLTDIEFSGTTCDVEDVIETIDYMLSGNTISFTNGDDPVEIIELTSTTLRYQETYTEMGVDYTDIYTYTRQ